MLDINEINKKKKIKSRWERIVKIYHCCQRKNERELSEGNKWLKKCNENVELKKNESRNEESDKKEKRE